MMLELFTALRQKADVCIYPGLDSHSWERIQRESNLVLPKDHRTFLELTNGFESYNGYERLFGFGEQASINASWWNEAECWKFAWSGLADGYWCFAESAWGDQYAYSIDELKRQADPPVYILTSGDMSAQLGASSFSEHLQ